MSKTRITRTRSKSMIFRVVALLIKFLVGTFHSLSDPVSPAESIADARRCSCNPNPVRLQRSLTIQLSRNWTGSLGSQRFFLSESGLGWGKWETAVSLPRSNPRVALPLSFAVSTPHYSDRKKPLATQASTFRASLTGQQADIFNNMQCPYERWTKVERENEGGGVGGGGASILIPTPPHCFLLHFFFWLRSTFLAANEF